MMLLKNETLIKAVTNDTKGVLLPIMKASYQLEPVSKYDLAQIAMQTNKDLGYTLFEDVHYPRLVKDAALVTRAVQYNAIRPIDENSNIDLKTQLEALMKNAVKIQNEKYDEIVLPVLGDSELYQDAYRRYLDELQGFDASAFRKSVHAILELKETDPKEFANWSDRFEYVPEYSNERNAFDKKTKEIHEIDGTQADRQAIFDSLDRARTSAHNGVISLFNTLNEFATKNKIAQPYPAQKAFDKNNPMDRAHVGDVLLRQEVLLESVYKVLDSEKTVASDTEMYKNMSLKEQLEAARAKQTIEQDASELKDAVENLYKNEKQL